MRTLISFLFFFPFIASAAISRDVNSSVNTTNDPVTWSHTASANATVGILGCSVNDASTDTISSVTWGGEAMTLLQKNGDPGAAGGGTTYLFGIVLPPTGSQNISIDLTSSQLVRCSAETYAGVLNIQTSTKTLSNTDTSNTTNATTTTDGTYAVNWTQDMGGTPSPGSNETQIVVIANNIMTDYDAGNAGYKSMTTNLAGNDRAVGTMVILSRIEPIPEASTTVQEAVNYADFFIDVCALLAAGFVIVFKRIS